MTQQSTGAVPFLRDSVSDGDAVVTACGLRVDFSRQRLTAADLQGLFKQAAACGVMPAFADMMAGNVVNRSEGRAALHTALRASYAGAPMHEEVMHERRRMYDVARRIRSGAWRGCRGDKITDVINIGIGGSEMGPRAVYHALRSSRPEIKLHFLSSVDGILLERILDNCNPRSTLVVISSKSFKTRETLVNAGAVDQWFLNHGIVGSDRNRHMLVVSANPDAVNQMCLAQENWYRIWDWVGGRFSVWGAVGLPVAIALGPEVFSEFLCGAADMDAHTATAAPEKNLPLLLALMAYWNVREHGIMTHCLLPYDERLRVMVPWLQQLEMESLGKTRTPDGVQLLERTGQALWGANGNEAQHSFYQWLREGTGSTSIDILWSEMPGHRYAEQYRVLLANARAQTEALITRDADLPYFNAVSAIAVDAVTPRRLGSLMAMYEHKTTMLGTLFQINPFDQPGVELGKRLSRQAESDAGSAVTKKGK